MNKIALKNKITQILLVSLILSSVNILPVANAGYLQVPRNVCTLAVFPFNGDIVERLLGANGNPFINKLNSANCNAHLNVANATPYSPQPPVSANNPYAANAEGRNVPRAKHFHKYFNDSVQDDYYYMAFMKEFEITVEADAFASIEQGANDIKCGMDIVEGDADPQEMANCNTGNNFAQSWGGTKVSRTPVCANPQIAFANCPENQKNIKILFEFGMTTDRDIPIVWGDNGNNFGDVPGDLHTEDNPGRNMEFFLDFESKDNDSIWSATTTSRTLIIHRAILKSNFLANGGNAPCADNNVNTGGNGWCYMPTPGNFETEPVTINNTPREFHWFPVGSVATVWKEQPPAECTGIRLNERSLTVNDAAAPNNINGKTAHELWVDNVTFSRGDIPDEAQLQWTSESTGLFFTHDNAGYHELPGARVLDTKFLYTSRATHVYYINPSDQDGHTVNVRLIKENGGNYAEICKDDFPVLPQSANICESITLVKDPNPVQIEDQEAYKFNVSSANFSGATPAEAQVQWSAPSTGKFYTFFMGFHEAASNTINNTKLTVPLPVNFPVYYVNTGNNNQEVTATLVDTNNNNRPYDINKCVDSLPAVGIAPPVCKELKVDHPTNIFEQTLSTFTGQSINDQDPAGPYNEGKIRYSVEDGYGSFFTEDPGLTPVNTSPMVNETVDMSAARDFMNNLWINNNPINFNLQAHRGLLSFDFSNGFASALLAFVPGPQLVQDLSGVDLGQGGEPVQRDPIAPIGGIQHAVHQSIEVEPGTKVWFFADKASNSPVDNVIHIEQLSSAGKPLNNICKKDFPISPFSTCDNLLVNHDNVIKENQISEFNSKAIDGHVPAQDFGGQITYSVNSTDYGRFYLHDPSAELAGFGYIPNDSGVAPVEFDPAIAINAPAGGFCSEGPIEQGFGGVPKNREVAPATIDITAPTPTSTYVTPATPSYTTPITIAPPPANTATTVTTTPAPTTTNTSINYSGIYVPSVTLLQLKPQETINVVNDIATGYLFQQNFKSTVTPQTFNYQNLGANSFFNIIQDIQPVAPNNLNIPNPQIPNNPFRLNLQGLLQRVEIDPVDASYQEITVDPGTPVWFAAKKPGNNVIHVKTACTEANGCIKAFSIAGVPKCDSFNMEVSKPTPLKVGENAGIRIAPELSNGVKLPDSTKIKITKNTTGGELTSVTNGQRPVTLGDFPATFHGSDHAGTFALSVDPLDPMYAEVCQDHFLVTAEAPPICKDLTYILQEFFRANEADKVNSLEENNFYELTSNVTLNREVQDAPLVTYSIKNNYGAFITLPADVPLRSAITFGLKALEINNNVTKQTLGNILGNDNLNSMVKAKEGKTVYLITFTDTPAHGGINEDILNIKASDFNQEACEKQIPLKKPEVEKECLDLAIVTPESPWEIDPTDNSPSQLFQIDVKTNPLSYKNDLFYHWEVTNGAGKWNNSNDDTVVDVRDTTQTLKDFDKNTEVDVYATDTRNGEKINACKDSISATVKEEKKKPKISKYVYPQGKVDDKDTIINIGEKRSTQFVTYLVAFTPGDSKSVEIWEDSMNHNQIQSEGELNGTLDLDQMSINILNENGHNYAFMRSERYTKDSGSSSYRDSNFADPDPDRKIFCSDRGIGDNQFCIDSANDRAELMREFGNGDHIKFKNVNNLKDGDQIIIKYRAINNSVVDNEKCKDLASSNGCGEEFDNTIKFKAYEDNDFEKEFENGRDSAKVIVICPYVITRGGGDSFFTDIIDTGTDVAKCSEVKSCEGVCITPPKDDTPKNVNTGAGEISKDLQLTLPSHDICKYSNNGDNIEGYNDVLKNFSSTVCEVESVVASIWKEKNINESIAANIERLARFGSNLNGGTLDSMDSLRNVNNAASGVFISDGKDITIDANDGYLINYSDSVPAAQTYIIRNANLHIKSDINYAPTTFMDQTKIPSAAFIVIDGNIIIDDDVGHLDGIYMAVDLDKNGDGKVTNSENFDLNATSSTPLSIYGNLIGNVYELFATRKGYGDPTKDEGSVVVHYDSRILLNTPPGISELVDVDQSLVPG